MKRDRTLYFFGAGASAAEEPAAPTSADLLRGGLSRRKGQYQTLVRFLEGWGFTPDGQELPYIEELLSVLDTCLSKGEPIGQAWSLSDLAKCREELVSCIYDLIGESLDVQANSSKEHSLYRKLLSGVDLERTSLISLNYDLLLDRALYQMGIQPDYALEFFDGHPPHTAGTLKLYKLHGSLNWGYCPSCFSTVFSREKRLPADAVCPTCEGPVRVLIIPPTPLKIPPSPFLSALWKKAEWELAQACEIVFIGYSLSESDANIRYLLFRGFFGYAPKVTVVLKQPPSEGESPVTGRYQRLFPRGVAFFWGGFENYLAR